MTQEEYNVSLQATRILHTKIIVKNYDFSDFGSLEGVVVGFPSFTIDSESNIRRTCSISLVPTSQTFEIKSGSAIWLDKYIQVYVGIEDITTREPIYTNMGIYLIDNPERVYSATDNTLSFKLVDLMSKLTGMRNGYLEGMSYIIPAGSNVRNVMIATLEEFGFDKDKCDIDECPYEVPQDINISSGGTAYDILSQLLNIADNYEMYFDVDGVFHYHKIPMNANEGEIVAYHNFWNNVLINYNVSTDFENVKNIVEVYGQTHTIANYSDATIVDNGKAFGLIMEQIKSYTDGLLVGFTTPKDTQLNTLYGLVINQLGSRPIVDDKGNYPTYQPNTYYVCKYVANGDYFRFLGHITPYAIAQENNVASPFYVGGSIGKIRIVLQGDNYDNLYTDLQCQDCAEYELYKRCLIQNSITITCVPIYWLDVNDLIEVTLPNKYGQDETMICLVKSINTSDTQTISLMNVSANILVEDFLDIDSTNIVQNKVITQEFNKIAELLG
jgi:hypothetical protein